MCPVGNEDFLKDERRKFNPCPSEFCLYRFHFYVLVWSHLFLSHTPGQGQLTASDCFIMVAANIKGK